jgi:membrane-associated protease RseP (regulator of RpoE activity)
MNDPWVQVHPRARVPLPNILLFVATVATTLFAGAAQFPSTPGAQTVGRLVLAGIPFAASIIGILLCHEMGHYLMARAYGVDSTLPFFIPVPFGIGTFGAVIRMRSAMPSRRAVLDIGAAGPIAGFLAALPLLAWGLAHSEVRAVAEVTAGGSNLGSPFAIAQALLQGKPLSGGQGAFQLMGDSLVTWGVQRFVLGNTPAGYDVVLHPVAFAAWIGLFVTTLNLIPIGQLDGGHITYALLGGRRAHLASRLVSLGLFASGIFLSWNWLVWWVLTRFFVGLPHPPALVEEPLGPGRRALAWASLALFAVTFIPVPISV